MQKLFKPLRLSNVLKQIQQSFPVRNCLPYDPKPMTQPVLAALSQL